MINYFKYFEGNVEPASLVYSGKFTNENFLMEFSSNYWFNQELRGLNLIKDKPYSPIVNNINFENLTISFKWGESLNHMIFKKTAPKNWKSDVNLILEDLENSNCYKLNLFDHTFFYLDNNLYVFDAYAILSNSDIIMYDDIASVLTTGSKDRFMPFINNNGSIKVKEIYNASKSSIGRWIND
jgi:hypothetical protein